MCLSGLWKIKCFPEENSFEFFNEFLDYDSSFFKEENIFKIQVFFTNFHNMCNIVKERKMFPRK